MNQAFTDACGFIMPLGKFKGQTLARIGSSDEGLKYLDWLVGQSWLNSRLKVPLETYLKHPAMGSQVERIIEY
jgi:uncharacterized protein (DUF3820 family)